MQKTLSSFSPVSPETVFKISWSHTPFVNMSWVITTWRATLLKTLHLTYDVKYDLIEIVDSLRFYHFVLVRGRKVRKWQMKVQMTVPKNKVGQTSFLGITKIGCTDQLHHKIEGNKWTVTAVFFSFMQLFLKRKQTMLSSFASCYLLVCLFALYLSLYQAANMKTKQKVFSFWE